ncbi:MAG: hypothetical protein HY670_09200 [Chloroflexi bacterium]|nr:hypothetical protein [Chloroflexota bacterium]
MDVIKEVRLMTEDEKLMADLSKYRQMALDMGAADARVFPTSNLVQGIRTRLAGCFFPRCPCLGLSMWCPPNWETPFELSQTIRDSYKYAIVFRGEIPPEIWTGPAAGSSRSGFLAAQVKVYGESWGEEAEEYWRKYAEDQHVTRQMVSFKEISASIMARARREGHPFAFHTSAGCCADKQCAPFGSVCVALRTGICRFPNDARPDGAGAMYYDWLRTLPSLGWQYTNVGWSVLPEDIQDRKPSPGITSIVFIE